ncbi:MAG: tyrosine-type recombinase/integrase, partial [Pseudonocardiaceae bacterium]
MTLTTRAAAANAAEVAAADAPPTPGQANTHWQDRFPPRSVPDAWPTTRLGRAEVDRLMAAAASALKSTRVSENRRWGLPYLLNWLQDQPGDTWQDRWLASGADSAGEDWARIPEQWLRRRGKHSKRRLEMMTGSLLILVGADVLRPSLRWLLTGGKKRKIARNMVYGRDTDGFERLRRLCEQDEAITREGTGDILFRSAVIVAAKGGLLSDVTIGDVLEILALEHEIRQQVGSAAATVRMLREAGILAADVPSLREIRSLGQRSVEQLVDRHPIACQPMRDLFVEYLRERQPAIDHSTLVGLAYHLVGCFWIDLERHHRGIDSLRLPREVAGAWKRRLRTKTTTITRDGQRVEVETERLGNLDILATVRAFYLDLAEWALEDPSRWAVWVAPCPISQDDLIRRKFLRRRKARMDSRTRERLPVLPVLIETTNRWRRDTHALLAAGQQTTPGQTFTAASTTLTRVQRPTGRDDNVWIHDEKTSKLRLLNRSEEHAFWAWAIIEVLRHTGIRAEELLELSHHSLVQYRLPSTGELVPLLQIAPSKTDTERLLVVSPELAEVLSAVIRRLRQPDGSVPLVSAYDHHERVWLAPAPLLFQRRVGAENRSLGRTFVTTLLDEALARTGLTDPATGQSLRFTAHDFRRIFITDAVLNGLPPHIAQIIAGHRDIGVTMGYKAVYPDEAITSHRAFLARRRALRPSEEYRQPTDEEWQEFLGHFERRKVSIGTCGRAFGTSCIHEHACVRCSLLWPDPSQQSRLLEIRDNLKTRVAEAKREGWLGEVEGLQISLAGAEDKLAQT